MKEIVPSHLYHYTDQAGFIGIIENKQLWATKIQYLNDNKEFSLAIGIAKEILQKKLSLRLRRSTKGVITDLVDRISKMEALSICVCSFSEQGDLLSQWRGYSKGMAGYSIGFDADKLNEVAIDNSFLMSKCIYEPEQQREKISGVLDLLISKHRTNLERIRVIDAGVGRVTVITPFVREVNKELSLIFPLMKDQNFKEESEWRLITKGGVRPRRLSFRTGNSNIIPFTKVNLHNLDNELIKKIIVGHTPNKELAILSTRDFLKKERLLKVPVEGSGIPFRNW